jgi:ATP-dependent DNA helicase RecG
MLVHREFTHAFSSKFLIFSDRVITENWTKPVQYGDITLENWESHTKNPLITKVFREMKWVEELGSGQKNIKKYAPLYYDNYQIEIQSKEKFVFSITYRNPKEFVLDTDKSEISWSLVEEILTLCNEPKSLNEILIMSSFKDRATFMKNCIKPLIEDKLLVMTVPDKPNSRLQKYYITDKGKRLIKK